MPLLTILLYLRCLTRTAFSRALCVIMKNQMNRKISDFRGQYIPQLDQLIAHREMRTRRNR